MVLGKKVTIFDWECGRNSAPRDGQKRPCYRSYKYMLDEFYIVALSINMEIDPRNLS